MTRPTRSRHQPKPAANTKSILQNLAAERHTVQTDHGSAQLTVVELLLRLVQHHAASGNATAITWIDRFRSKLAPEPAVPAGLLVAPAPLTLEEAIARAEQHNLRHPNDPSLDENALDVATPDLTATSSRPSDPGRDGS
jgi:hypothetical protein